MQLEVKIKKRLADFTLNADFIAGDKEILGILGASGCGKSMTLKCIAGIERPDAGYIALNGQVLFDSEAGINLSPQKRKIGYLFQNYALFPHMTVEKNIASGILGKRGKKELVAHYLKMMRLEDCANRLPGELSGGQKQRTALARIFASQPQALLLDEPFSALDGLLKWHIGMELYDWIAACQCPVLFVSHNRGEIYQFCDKICILANGKMEAPRPKKALFAAPRTLAGARLIGCRNYSRCEILPHGIYASDWQIEIALPKDFKQDGEFLGLGEKGLFLLEDGQKKVNTWQFEIVRRLKQYEGELLLVRKNEKARPIWLFWQDEGVIKDNFIELSLCLEQLFFLKGEAEDELF